MGKKGKILGGSEDLRAFWKRFIARYSSDLSGEHQRALKCSESVRLKPACVRGYVRGERAGVRGAKEERFGLLFDPLRACLKAALAALFPTPSYRTNSVGLRERVRLNTEDGVSG